MEWWIWLLALFAVTFAMGRSRHDPRQGRQLLKVHADFGGFYNKNGAKLILAEVNREYGQAAVGEFIRELELEHIFSFKPGTSF